jgi:hypothetical protein
VVDFLCDKAAMLTAAVKEEHPVIFEIAINPLALELEI